MKASTEEILTDNLSGDVKLANSNDLSSSGLEDGSEDQNTEPLAYGDFTEDGDVIERIKSRASVSSDVQQLRALRDKYKEGFFEISEDDPLRPQNWPLRKRIWHTMAFGISAFTAQMGATVFSPAGYQVAQQHSKGSELGVLAFSVYFIGNTIGPMFIAPAADAYGRKLCVFAPGFISGVLLCVCANADSIPSVIVYRFLAGVFASGPITCSSGAVADMFRPKFRASALVMFATYFIVGTTIPPILGTLLVNTGSYGWRWCSWLGGLLSLVVSTTCFLILDETYLPVIEKRAARAIRLNTGYWGLHTTQDKYEDLNVAQTLLIYVKVPLMMMLIPNIFSAVLCSAFSTGVLFFLITTVGQQFQLHHNFSVAASQCTLVGILIGFIFGCMANVAASQRYANLSEKLKHNPPPEIRLPPMMFFGWLLPAGLFLYGWTLRKSIHWIVPIIGLGLFGAGFATIVQGSSNYLTDAYTKRAASAHTANSCIRYIFAGVFPLFSRQLHTSIDNHWAPSLLGFIGLLIIPIPWILFFFGGRFRQHDPFGKRLDV